VLQACRWDAQGKNGVNFENAHSAFCVAAYFGVNLAAQGLWRLLEFSQSEKQRIRQTISYRRAEKLYRRGAHALAERRGFVAHDGGNVCAKADIELVVLLLG
jgi:hypothetical protein